MALESGLSRLTVLEGVVWRVAIAAIVVFMYKRSSKWLNWRKEGRLMLVLVLVQSIQRAKAGFKVIFRRRDGRRDRASSTRRKARCT